MRDLRKISWIPLPTWILAIFRGCGASINTESATKVVVLKSSKFYSLDT